MANGEEKQSQKQILQELVGVMKSTEKLNKDLLTAIKDLPEEIDKKSKEGKDTNKSLEDINKKKIPALEKFQKWGTDQVLKTIKEGFKLQERGLARGFNLGELTSTLEQTTDGLTGWGTSITGYSNALDSGVAALEVGFRGTLLNNKELQVLSVATKLTGGQQKKVLMSLAKNTASMGVSNEQMSTLANTTLSLSQKYGLTTEELVGAIDGLGEQLLDFAALGIGPEIMEASMRLSAALGPQMAEMGPELIKAITQGSSMVQASLFGITQERQQILNKEGNTNRAALQAVITAGENADRIVQQFTQGGRETSFALDRAADVYGKEVKTYKAAYERLQEAAKEQGLGVQAYAEQVAKQNEVSEKFKGTFANLQALFLSPLQEIFTAFTAFLEPIMGFFTQNTIGQWITRLGGWIFALIAAIASWKAAVALFTVGKAVGGAAKVAGGVAGAAGGGIGASIGGVGEGIGKLGKGLGEGIGGLIQKSLEGIAKGVAALGNPKVFLGALAIAAIGASLIPFALAFKLMKGVGIGTILTLAAALLVFGAAAVVFSFILPVILLGAVAIAALGVALLPLAFAANLAAPAMKHLAEVLDKLSSTSVGSLYALGPALVSVAAGLAAMSAGNVVGSIAAWLTPGEGPVDKLVRLGDAAKPINKLVASLRNLPSVLRETVAALAGLSSSGAEKGLAKLTSIGSVRRSSNPQLPPGATLEGGEPIERTQEMLGRARERNSTGGGAGNTGQQMVGLLEKILVELLEGTDVAREGTEVVREGNNAALVVAKKSEPRPTQLASMG